MCSPEMQLSRQGIGVFPNVIRPEILKSLILLGFHGVPFSNQHNIVNISNTGQALNFINVFESAQDTFIEKLP